MASRGEARSAGWRGAEMMLGGAHLLLALAEVLLPLEFTLAIAAVCVKVTAASASR